MTETTNKAEARHGLGWGPDLRAPLVRGLAVLLVLQLLVAAGLAWNEPGLEPPAAQAPLFRFTPDQVTKVRIDGAQGKEGVTLTKTADGKWALPELGNFPAQAMKISQLLAQVAELGHPLPIATTEAARKRFKVTDDGFERRLRLDGESGPVATLLIGDAPGYKRLFGRPAEDPAVYDLGLSLADLSSRPDDWLDTGLLRLEQDKIQRIAGRGWAMTKGDNGWILDGSDKKVEQSIADEAAMRVANLGYRGVLGTEDRPEYGQNAPALELEVRTADGKTLGYRISKVDKSEDYVLKDAARPYYFRLSQYDLEGLLDLDLDKLTGAKAEVEKKGAERQTKEGTGPTQGAATEPSGTQTAAGPEREVPAEDQTADPSAAKAAGASPSDTSAEAETEATAPTPESAAPPPPAETRP